MLLVKIRQNVHWFAQIALNDGRRQSAFGQPWEISTMEFLLWFSLCPPLFHSLFDILFCGKISLLSKEFQFKTVASFPAKDIGHFQEICFCLRFFAMVALVGFQNRFDKNIPQSNISLHLLNEISLKLLVLKIGPYRTTFCYSLHIISFFFVLY